MKVGGVGGYDRGGPAQHLFNRAERKHLHKYLQNDIKNRGLFTFRLWMARRGGGGHIILGLKRDSIRNCKQAEIDLQLTLKFQGIESQDYAQTAFVFFPVMKHISFSKKSTARC